jgi:CRP/FNR family transcriptional regulator, dissimilatory nitrate respiration regulator
MQNLKRILGSSPLFNMLDEGQLDGIAAATRPIRASSNTRIINQGDSGKGVFLVVYGQVRLGFDMKHGSEKTLAILGQNKCFGLGEMLLEETHIAFAKTTMDSMVLHTPRDSVLRVAKDNFGFAHELMICMSRQFRTLVHDIESYSLQTAKQRLVGYLLRQRKMQDEDCIELVASKTLIASRLSLTPETLSRLFHDLASDGVISITGRRIRILDTSKIETMVA